MAKPILYNYFRSSASYRVRCALHLKNIDFEYCTISLTKNGGEQFKPEYKKLNPMAQVPYFVDGDVGIAESVAIIQYMDSKWHEPALFPKEPKAWAPIVQVCEVINSGIQPYQNTIVRERLDKVYKLSEEQREDWMKFFVGRGLESLEQTLSKTAGKYSFGDKVSAADCFLVPQMFASKRFKVDISKYKTLMKIYENCEQLEGFQKAHPAKQIDFEA